ncbi:MAG: hypothetical protein IPH82_26675, partial [Chloroflexi bacterium]|nr:hypothetical protein [Chloroflexota bacterium]
HSALKLPIVNSGLGATFMAGHEQLTPAIPSHALGDCRHELTASPTKTSVPHCAWSPGPCAA